MINLTCDNPVLLNNIENGKFDWNKLESPYLIFNDIGFDLLVDGVKVVRYRVIFERVNTFATGITSAEIQYENLFFESDDYELKEKYLGKGYTKKGLKLICDYLLKKCNIPYIHADISEDNTISQMVATSCEFINGNLYHPNARDLYQKALGDKYSKENIKNLMHHFDLQYENTLSNSQKKR